MDVKLIGEFEIIGGGYGGGIRGNMLGSCGGVGDIGRSELTNKMLGMYGGGNLGEGKNTPAIEIKTKGSIEYDYRYMGSTR